MSLSKEKDDGVFEKALRVYARFLRDRPVLTKAVSCGVTGAVGNLLGQMIAKKPGEAYRWRSALAFTLFGFGFTGPMTHYFYYYMDKVIPKHVPYSTIKRVFMDRAIFTPPFLVIYLYVLSILEGQSSAAAIEKIRETFWTTLKMNWRIWTSFQYININYIPQQYRVLFGSMVALIWNIYVAKTRK